MPPGTKDRAVSTFFPADCGPWANKRTIKPLSPFGFTVYRYDGENCGERPVGPTPNRTAP